MRKSESVVRITGSGCVSAIRTRQASARLMGTSAYFSKSLSTGSTSLSRLKAAIRARRRSSPLTAGAPRAPRRWMASGRTASQARQAQQRLMKVWVFNSQNVTPDVQRVSQLARAAGIPIATVTETLSPASDSFEQWQVSELEGLARALARATGR